MAVEAERRRQKGGRSGTGGRGRIEHHLAIDVRRLRREGVLPNDAGPGSLAFDPVSESSLEVLSWTLLRLTWPDGAMDIQVLWQPHNELQGKKTGWQPWFACPGCRKPRALLYRSRFADSFACRDCLDTSATSAAARATRAEARLELPS
jgi:hypothetical protein